MADKAINDLTEALQIFSGDWFVLQQGSEAKKLNGNTLKQYLAQIEVNSIESVTFDAQGRCHIVLTDGTEIISQTLKGADGTDGTDGEDAPTITNIAIDANYHLIITLSDGTSYDAGYCRGASGAGTGDMLAEVYDPENGARQVAFKNSVVPKTDYAPSQKTAEMTQEVGKDAQGKLWTSAGSAIPATVVPQEYHLYVSAATGNDGNNGRETFTPVKTLQKALELVPNRGIGYAVVINLIAYDDNTHYLMPELYGFFNLKIKSFSSTKAIIDGVIDPVEPAVFIGGYSLYFEKVKFSCPVYVTGTATFFMCDFNITNTQGLFTNSNALHISGHTHAIFWDGTITARSTDTAVDISQGGICAINGTDITAGTGIYCADGIAIYHGSTITATTQFVASNSGRIFGTNQSNVPSY